MTYIEKLRIKIGKDKFIHPAARIIIENTEKEVLIIERRDNGKLGIPAGSLECNETIEECIKREVKEETGLTVISLEVIGISSNPEKEYVKYPNGDKIQYFTVEFYAKEWTGRLSVEDSKEIKSVKFMGENAIAKLPKNELSTFQSLDFFRRYGKLMLK